MKNMTPYKALLKQLLLHCYKFEDLDCPLSYVHAFVLK